MRASKNSQSAALAHLVERHLAKVEVASSSLVTRSNMVPWPSGKAKVCKTFAAQKNIGTAKRLPVSGKSNSAVLHAGDLQSQIRDLSF